MKKICELKILYVHTDFCISITSQTNFGHLNRRFSKQNPVMIKFVNICANLAFL